MTAIENLIGMDQHLLAPEAVEVDPLREMDALQEVQILDARICPLTAVAAFLMELRTSLQFDLGNSALLVVRGVGALSWSCSQVSTPLVALSIVSSVPEFSAESFRIGVGFFPEADLIVHGVSAEFHVLDVEGIGEVPPDYSDGDLAGIRHGLPSWSSACRLLQSSTSR